jgi:hypothetical protein
VWNVRSLASQSRPKRISHILVNLSTLRRLTPATCIFNDWYRALRGVCNCVRGSLRIIFWSTYNAKKSEEARQPSIPEVYLLTPIQTFAESAEYDVANACQGRKGGQMEDDVGFRDQMRANFHDRTGLKKTYSKNDWQSKVVYCKEKLLKGKQ